MFVDINISDLKTHSKSNIVCLAWINIGSQGGNQLTRRWLGTTKVIHTNRGPVNSRPLSTPTIWSIWRLLQFSDPRTEHLWLISSPIPGICILVFYNYFVNHLGPRLMEDRKPFKLDRFMIYYNIVQILACLYLFIMVRTQNTQCVNGVEVLNSNLGGIKNV